MKLLIYGDYFLPVVGGVQTALKHLAEGLAESYGRATDQGLGRIEVTLVTRSEANGMDDSTLPYSVVRRPGFWQLFCLIREADLIHVAGPCLLPMAIGRLLRKPVVVEHHGYQAICPNGLLFQEPSRVVCSGYFMRREYGKCVRCCASTMGLNGSIRALLLNFPRRWLCEKMTANITISNHVATRLKLPRSRTVYYGIDEAHCGTTGSPLPRAGGFQLAYVGRLVVEKGPAVLLDAVKILNDRGVRTTVSYIGDGPERDQLENLVRSLGVGELVTFTGDLRGSALERTVAGMDLVVMPSLCEETAGLSAIEQMMRGKVVIVSDIGGLSEVVGDAGLKFAPGDALALSVCVQRAMDSPALVASLGSAARARAMQLFRRDCMIQGHVSLYRETLGMHDSSRSRRRDAYAK
jgi:glycosyltransferase involved in cell wall biosynthesis